MHRCIGTASYALGGKCKQQLAGTGPYRYVVHAIELFTSGEPHHRAHRTHPREVSAKSRHQNLVVIPHRTLHWLARCDSIGTHTDAVAREFVQNGVGDDRLKRAGTDCLAKPTTEALGIGQTGPALGALEDVRFDSLDFRLRRIRSPVLREFAEGQTRTRWCRHGVLLRSRHSRIVASAR